MSTTTKVNRKSAASTRQTVQIVRRQIVSQFDLVDGPGHIADILHNVIEGIVTHTAVGDIGTPQVSVTDDLEFTVAGHLFTFSVKPEDES